MKALVTSIEDLKSLKKGEEIQAEEGPKKPEHIFMLDPIFKLGGMPSFTRVSESPDEDKCEAIGEVKIGSLLFYILQDFDGTIFLEANY